MSMIYVFGDCELDTYLYEFRQAGEPLKLEPKVFDVLVYLIESRERVVTKDELLTASPHRGGCARVARRHRPHDGRLHGPLVRASSLSV
jgi:DNA-binding response OmpR family regulator